MKTAATAEENGDGVERKIWIGYVSILTAVLIWSGWIVATRHAMLEARTPLDIALLRYGTPALLLAPICFRKGFFPPGESPLRLIVMTIGWGGPFVLLISTGVQWVDASLFGPLVPGLLPLVVALWERGVEGRPVTPGRGLGLVFILTAVALILVPAMIGGDSGVLTGAPFLLCACCGWSAFTIAFRRTGLTGLEAAAYVCVYSTPFLLIAAFIFGSDLPEFGLFEMAWHVTMQGVLSGMVSVAAYGYAVKALGLGRASAFTCLVPVIAAVGGWFFLSEAVGLAGWAAAISACIGVLLVNRYAA